MDDIKCFLCESPNWVAFYVATQVGEKKLRVDCGKCGKFINFFSNDVLAKNPVVNHATVDKPPHPMTQMNPGSSDDPGNFTMPFGKHRGCKLKDIPADYLKWCVENMTPGLATEAIKKFFAAPKLDEMPF